MSQNGKINVHFTVRKIKHNKCSVLAVQHILHNSFENSTFSRLILQPHYHATLDWVKECQSPERGLFLWKRKKWNAENDDPLNIRGRFTSWWWWEVRLFEKSNLKAKLRMKNCHSIVNVVASPTILNRLNSLF